MLACSLLAVTELAAQRGAPGGAATFVVRGSVVDTGRVSVVGAEVIVLLNDTLPRRAWTDGEGTFVLAALPEGRHELIVRRLGFRPRRYDVTVGSDVASSIVRAVLTPMPAELERMLVEGRIDQTKGKLRQFYEHKARGQFGFFFTPEELHRKNLRVASELMRSVPGVQLIQARFGNAIRMRGCRPLVWLDGQRVPNAELDEVMDADDMAAVEVYPSLAGVPAQYFSPEGRCGTIVVWTRVT